jgi:hypothetical protein
MAARLANTMSNSLKGRPVQVRYNLKLNCGYCSYDLYLIAASCRVVFFKVRNLHNSLHFFSL